MSNGPVTQGSFGSNSTENQRIGNRKNQCTFFIGFSKLRAKLCAARRCQVKHLKRRKTKSISKRLKLRTHSGWFQQAAKQVKKISATR